MISAIRPLKLVVQVGGAGESGDPYIYRADSFKPDAIPPALT